jgi:sensor histidine kinase YesM
MAPSSECRAENGQASLPHPVQTSHVLMLSSTRKRRRRMAILVGVGSSLLSVLGFGALTAFEQYNSLISEMRSDLKHFNETVGEYVKRDNFQRYRDQVKDKIKELQETNVEKYRLEQELKASEKLRNETTEELRRLRERLAYLEGRQAAIASSSQQGQTPER